MSTKTLKLKPCRMWANYYDCDPIPLVHETRKRAVAALGAWSLKSTLTTPVAVIPLDDVERIITEARDAFVGHRVMLSHERMRAALAAIGVLPKRKKGGRK